MTTLDDHCKTTPVITEDIIEQLFTTYFNSKGAAVGSLFLSCGELFLTAHVQCDWYVERIMPNNSNNDYKKESL